MQCNLFRVGCAKGTNTFLSYNKRLTFKIFDKINTPEFLNQFKPNNDMVTLFTIQYHEYMCDITNNYSKYIIKVLELFWIFTNFN